MTDFSDTPYAPLRRGQAVTIHHQPGTFFVLHEAADTDHPKVEIYVIPRFGQQPSRGLLVKRSLVTPRVDFPEHDLEFVRSETLEMQQRMLGAAGEARYSDGYLAEQRALMRLHSDWEDKDKDQRAADAHTLQWTIQALLAAGFAVQYPADPATR